MGSPTLETTAGPGTSPKADQPEIDRHALARDLDALQTRLRESAGPEDLRHLRKIENWGRFASVLGYATAWIAPNPVTIFALSFGRFIRWTGIAHPVCHKGYEKIEGVPEARTAAVFARGWRRATDWLDWLDPEAWCEEHNIQHHYRLNEEADPDLVERNLAWVRDSRLPRWLKVGLVPLFAMSWKFVYYASSSLDALARAEARREGHRGESAEEALAARWSKRRLMSFLPNWSKRLWLRCLAPYMLVYFALVPALYAPLGLWAVSSVLINTILAEALTNAHAFLTIVPNHVGDDIYRFEGRTRGRPDFYLRQILGSANFRCGGDLNDAMHGWLNYQIEHHLWPDMTMLQYRRAQPEVKAICARHGVPYVQDSVWKRLGKTVAVIVGDTSMRRWVDPDANSDAKPNLNSDAKSDANSGLGSELSELVAGPAQSVA